MRITESQLRRVVRRLVNEQKGVVQPELFRKMGKLKYDNQIYKVSPTEYYSLAETLSQELGTEVAFDSTDLYDVKSSRTLVDGALSGRYTYDDLLNLASGNAGANRY